MRLLNLFLFKIPWALLPVVFTSVKQVLTFLSLSMNHLHYLCLFPPEDLNDSLSKDVHCETKDAAEQKEIQLEGASLSSAGE